MARSTDSTGRRHVWQPLLGGLLTGAFGMLALIVLSPTHDESATITGLDRTRSTRASDGYRYYVTGATASGLSFRIEGRALYRHVDGVGTPVHATAEVATIPQRVASITADDITGGRSKREGRPLAIAAIVIAAFAIRELARAISAGHGARAVPALSGGLIAGAAAAYWWAG